MNYKDYSLCQDCLSLKPIHPTNEGICHCGGDTCSCLDCQNTIKLLFEGVKDGITLGVYGDIEKWNPDTGIY